MKTRRRLVLRSGLALALALVAVTPLAAGPEPNPEVDPCVHAFGSDVNVCWAQEADRAETEMNQMYLALLQRLPKRAAESLEKAQGLWLEFMEAHIGTLYGVESPRARWGRDYPVCLSISRAALLQERTQQLKRLLEPDELTICPV